MNTHYLTPLFKPRSVALFGASDREDSVGGVVFRNLRNSGFNGKSYPINPKRDEVQGVRAYPSLDAIGKPVDLAVIATPAPTIPDIVEAYRDQPKKMDAFMRAQRLQTLLDAVETLDDFSAIPETSLLREFIGGGIYGQ